VATYAVKIACERPETCGKSLSTWDCQEIARKLQEDEIVPRIGRETVRKMLVGEQLRPWRYQMWLSSTVARDADFVARVKNIRALYTRPLAQDEVVLSADEKTSLQPRPRKSCTLPARSGKRVRVEHEYTRCGALNLFSAINTRTGKVYGRTARRKRQREFLAFLEQLDGELDDSIRVIHIVLDNLRMHTGKEVQAWLLAHPRLVFHHPPVHCSWMNQIEQWFSILQRKRLRVADFASLADLDQCLMQFIQQWNLQAHAFRWSVDSFEKILSKCRQAELLKAA
jgi:transposase